MGIVTSEDGPRRQWMGMGWTVRTQTPAAGFCKNGTKTANEARVLPATISSSEGSTRLDNSGIVVRVPAGNFSPLPNARPLLGSSQVKPSQAKPGQNDKWGAKSCAKGKSTPPCPLAIPAFDRIAGLSNRHLSLIGDYAYANDFEVKLRALTDLAKD